MFILNYSNDFKTIILLFSDMIKKLLYKVYEGFKYCVESWNEKRAEMGRKVVSYNKYEKYFLKLQAVIWITLP